MSEPHASCTWCGLAADHAAAGRLLELGRSKGWTLNPNLGAKRPALVLQPKDHVDGIEDIRCEVAAELGGLLVVVARAVKAMPGVDHVLVACLDIGHIHPHFHIVPRYEGDPRDAGLDLMNLPPPSTADDRISFYREVAESVQTQGS
jgi:diadenosine tetraphosphate (Ap4A) HIT family hydrolase